MTRRQLRGVGYGVLAFASAAVFLLCLVLYLTASPPS
jgi:hypothetical protein